MTKTSLSRNKNHVTKGCLGVFGESTKTYLELKKRKEATSCDEIYVKSSIDC